MSKASLEVGTFTLTELENELEEIDDSKDLKLILKDEKKGLDRVGAIELIEARIDALDNMDDEVEVEALPEEVEWEDAPHAEMLPLIRSGSWARISGSAKNVPEHARGRDVSVIDSVVHVGGPDTHSSSKYEYQEPGDVFGVVLVDTLEQFECTRAAFAAFGPSRNDVALQPA
jgi:hypothetical protein